MGEEGGGSRGMVGAAVGREEESAVGRERVAE